MADERFGPRLSHDDLNRALLARQHLAAPRDATVLDEVRHLVGLQSQVPSSPYPALWSRLAGFAPDDLGDACSTARWCASRRCAARCTSSRPTTRSS
nr:crosslink repair DNA glycosylase YcaQ family protein [Cellulosimicrobium sp. MM]